MNMWIKRCLAGAVFVSIAFACCGSAVTGSGLGAANATAGPHLLASFQLWGNPTSGQSNSTGQCETACVPSTCAVNGNHLQLMASSYPYLDAAPPIGHCYNFVRYDGGAPFRGDASDPLWELQPDRLEAIGYVTSNGIDFAYPENLYNGEQPSFAMRREVAAEAALLGIPNYVMVGGDDHGITGTPLSGIGVGTIAFNSMSTTQKAIARLAADAGLSFGTAAAMFLHSSADCSNWSYAPNLVAYQAAQNAQILAATGQYRDGGVCPQCTPLLMIQEDLECGSGFNLTPVTTVNAAQQSDAGLIGVVGTSYQQPISDAKQHRTISGHEGDGETWGHGYIRSELWQADSGPWFLPVAPHQLGVISASPNKQGAAAAGTFVRVGSVITVTYDMPPGECLTFDTTTLPHSHLLPQSPYAAAWPDKMGFEAWAPCSMNDGGYPVTLTNTATNSEPQTSCQPIAISNVAIVGCNQVQITLASNPAIGDLLLSYAMTPDGNTLADGGSYDGGYSFGGIPYVGTGPPNGVWGNLRATPCPVAAGQMTGRPVCDWSMAWFQAGL
jgi:hypothetical protein